MKAIDKIQLEALDRLGGLLADLMFETDETAKRVTLGVIYMTAQEYYRRAEATVKNLRMAACGMLALSLLSLGGCNAVNKLTGQDQHHDTPAPDHVDFFGNVPSPGPVYIDVTPTHATASIEAFVCTNACIETALQPYSIPVYTSEQPGLTTPYAMWYYAAPDLHVVLQNYGPSPDRIQYVIRSRP